MKIYLRLSMILSLPLFLMFFVNIMASFIYWKEPLNANDLLKFNHEFIFWCSIVGVISLSVVFSVQIMISYYVDKINTLDQENENYKNAKKELEQTKKVYLKLIEEINQSSILFTQENCYKAMESYALPFQSQLQEAKGEIERLRELMNCDPDDDLFESVKELDEWSDKIIVDYNKLNAEKTNLQSLLTQKDKEIEALREGIMAHRDAYYNENGSLTGDKWAYLTSLLNISNEKGV